MTSIHTKDVPSRPIVFTIGHSNQTRESFLDLLLRFCVNILIDTRSIPRSRAAPQFNKPTLKTALLSIGLSYVHKGKALGGRPKSAKFYDQDGHVRYDLIAQTQDFRTAVASIERGAQRGLRIALMCAEENPIYCHRRLLIGRVMLDHGIQIEHIRRNGTLIADEELVRQERRELADHQVTIFDHDGNTAWRSTQSVSRRSRPESSSNA